MLVRMTTLHGTEGLPPRAVRSASDLLKVLGHPVRLKLLELLLRHPRNVGELAGMVRAQPHVVSQHLKELRRVKAVSAERRGREVRYRATDPLAAQVVYTIQRDHLGRTGFQGGEAI